ncbi:MAG: DUF899 domain-containing protein [Verrucomicrobia bacterium]|nr:DUF899 domain-containing protein [Verrucomicrobiota bacterium]
MVKPSLDTHKIVSEDEWLRARKQLLTQEKEFTRLRDQLSQQRRELPWVKVEKNYVFDGPRGKETLADLFEGRSQLVVYHFMFAPEEGEQPCRACSFWADSFNPIGVHLNHRDVTMVAISRAPSEKLEAFKQRMGWNFKWVSSGSNDFNYDYHVSFTPAEVESGAEYNYAKRKPDSADQPGVSVFYQDGKGNIFHTYSVYARGIDILNTAYNYLDLVPKGRDEDGFDWPMAWLRYHDKYES